MIILWSDDNYVAIDKPAGLAVIPGRGEKTSALEQLAHDLGLPFAGSDDPRVRVVHRIDKDTSGVVLFAKNRPAQQHLSHQFQNNTVEKQYVALVAGRPPEQRGEIDAPMQVHPTRPKQMTISKHGRPARSLWQVEETFRGSALVRVFPKTGKTHQIRVHLKSIGLPLLIDPLYNPDGVAALMLSSFKRGYRPKHGEEERPLITRLTLHAERVRFKNMAGEMIEVVAPWPKDFRSAVNMLRKYGSR